MWLPDCLHINICVLFLPKQEVVNIFCLYNTYSSCCKTASQPNSRGTIDHMSVTGLGAKMKGRRKKKKRSRDKERQEEEERGKTRRKREGKKLERKGKISKRKESEDLPD